jgi:hypothetical protein
LKKYIDAASSSGIAGRFARSHPDPAQQTLPTLPKAEGSVGLEDVGPAAACGVYADQHKLAAGGEMKKAIESVRNLLGIRKRRRLLPRGPQPAPGSKIINGNLRMEVLEGLSPQLWTWLSNLGWRKAMYKYDRRKYDEIPVEWAGELYCAPADQWDKTLSAGTAAARGRGPLPPFRVQRVGWNAPGLDYLSSSDRVV